MQNKEKYYLLIFAGFILMFLLLHGNRGEDYNAMLSIENTRDTNIPIASLSQERESIKWGDIDYFAAPLLVSDDCKVLFMEKGGGGFF